MNGKSEKGGPKPRLALAIATGLGVGYAPIAPGTFGSLVGAVLMIATAGFYNFRIGRSPCFSDTFAVNSRLTFLTSVGLVSVLVCLSGVWAANRVSAYLGAKDPQIVVVDEISGQILAYFGFLASECFSTDWRSLLAGFVLFRIFDIWKPFPIRRAEKLPGGWGIMADDWLAGVYAAMLLALARHFGL